MIKPSGGVGPDPHHIGEWGHLGQSTLREIVSGEAARETRQRWLKRSNDWPSACQVCAQKAKTLGHSRRTFFDEMHALYQIPKPPELENADSFRLRFLDIATSNLCNLACVMCSSKLSSTWIGLENRLNKNGFTKERPGQKHRQVHQLSPAMIDNIFADPTMFESLVHLGLRGGEPFLDTTNDMVLTRILDLVPAQQLVLDVTSNGTKVSRTLLERNHELREVKLLLSLEGMGETYSLMRGGEHFSFEEFQDNLNEFAKLPNVHIYLVFLLTALNIDQLVPLWKWHQSLALPNVRLNFKNSLVSPSYLSPQLISKQHRQQVVRELEQSNWPLMKDTDRVMGFSNVHRALTQEYPGDLAAMNSERQTLQQFMQLYTEGRPDARATWERLTPMFEL